jgi:hypothetical protein
VDRGPEPVHDGLVAVVAKELTVQLADVAVLGSSLRLREKDEQLKEILTGGINGRHGGKVRSTAVISGGSTWSSMCGNLESKEVGLDESMSLGGKRLGSGAIL